MGSVEKRLVALERRFHFDPIMLEMPDGSKEEVIVRSGAGLLDLFVRSIQEMEAGVGFSREVTLIQRSIGGTEKGGYMVELCRALLNPVETMEEKLQTLDGV